MNDFKSLGLNAPILAALNEAGYTTPTPIQAKAIPTLIEGRDLIGIAQTGTGKTAAFALPILHRLAADPKPAPRKGCRVLVLSPTRELASQICDNFRAYSREQRLTVAAVFGGVAHRPQIQALSRGVDVLIATPGRLLDHLAAGKADISGTEILVLDEADQMLDLGFLKPIRQIVGRLSQKRQTLLFSATMPEQISRLAKDFLRNPERVSVTPVSSTAERVAQRVIHIDAPRKRHLLASLFAEQEMSRTLVFTRTKHGADRLAKHLQAGGVTVAAIHGNKSQNQRERALEAFRDARIQVLVATDIAARGIDIDDVTHVVNYELPEVPEAYVHRIGRTARAGASGSAISLCDDGELKYLRGIERLIKKKIPSETYRNGETVEDDIGSGYDPLAAGKTEREARTKRNHRRPSRSRKPSQSKPPHSKPSQSRSEPRQDKQADGDRPTGSASRNANRNRKHQSSQHASRQTTSKASGGDKPRSADRRGGKASNDNAPRSDAQKTNAQRPKNSHPSKSRSDGRRGPGKPHRNRGPRKATAV